MDEISLDEHIRFVDRSAYVFERLYKLAQKGFVPDWSRDLEDCIILEHPKQSYKNRTITLYSGGSVRTTFNDNVEIGLEETDKFESFLRSVPNPSLWDRSHTVRTYVGAALMMLVVWTGVYLFVNVSSGILKEFFR